MNTYKKLSNGEWGAWIDTGYGKTAIKKPVAGDVVEITTKNGETHRRVIKAIAKDFKSGCIVMLVDDAEIAKRANERYQAMIKDAETVRVTRRDAIDFALNEGYDEDGNEYDTVEDYARGRRAFNFKDDDLIGHGES